jgi:hypothetical protein
MGLSADLAELLARRRNNSHNRQTPKKGDAAYIFRMMA